jgi:hypothetical protein
MTALQASSRDDMAAAFKATGAALACLCSSDEVYAGEAEAAAQMPRAAGAKRIFLAGRPARGKRRSPPPGSAASSMSALTCWRRCAPLGIA